MSSTLTDAFNDLVTSSGQVEVPDTDIPYIDDQEEFSFGDEPEDSQPQEVPEPTPDVVPPEEEESPAPAEDGGGQPTETPAPEGKEDSEYIFVSDDGGRKKLKVDYADREGIKNAYRLAAGYKKMKVERDQFLTKNRDGAKELEELKQFKQMLNDTYAKDGIAGIFAKVSGGTPWEDFVLQEALKVQQYKNASPDERKAMDAIKENQQLKAAQAAWVKQQEEMTRQAEEAREAAELEKFTAMITPSFEKFRFHEIADQAKADRMDARLWREAKEEFKRLETEGTEVTVAVAAKVFKEIADDIRSLIGDQAKEKATKVIEDKKKVAQTKVAGATEKAKGKNAKMDSFAEDALKIGPLEAFYKLVGR